MKRADGGASLTLPRDVVHKLGGGDAALGHAIACKLFNQHPLMTTPGAIDGDTVRKLGNAVERMTTLPQRALEASENLRQGGDYDPGPAMETAGMMAGARFPFAKAGELGTFGGKLYSATADAVNAAKFDRANAATWHGYLRNTPGVKGEELNWLGTPEFLQSQKGPVTKEALAAHIKENQLELKDATKSGSGSDPDNFDSPRYANYTLPGGQNYREMLLTMPDKTPPEYRAAIAAMDEPARRELAAKYPEQMGFHSSHWDEPNVLAHVRFNDRTVNGKKTLFIEEVQSDWHQQGKRSGYDIAHDPSEYAIEGNGPWVIRNQKTGDFVHYFNRKHDAEGYLGDIQKGKILPWKKEGLVPDAPFKTAWPELAMKRILKHAADNGYDQVAWTPGEVQAARYDLSRHIDRLEWERGGTSGFTPLEEIEKTYPGIDTWGTLRAWDKSGKKIFDETRREKELPETIGKEAADRLLAIEPKRAVRGGTAISLRGRTWGGISGRAIRLVKRDRGFWFPFATMDFLIGRAISLPCCRVCVPHAVGQEMRPPLSFIPADRPSRSARRAVPAGCTS